MNLRPFYLPVVVMALVLHLGATNSPAVSGDDLRTMYVKFLGDEGYRPAVDKDGDVTFKREGKTYFVSIDEKDPKFFMVVLPNIWPIENATERTQVMKAADKVNGGSKVAKVYTKSNNVWISTEMFLPDQHDFATIFARTLSALDGATKSFVDAMKSDH